MPIDAQKKLFQQPKTISRAKSVFIHHRKKYLFRYASTIIIVWVEEKTI